MQSSQLNLSNFSRSIQSASSVYRLDDEQSLNQLMAAHPTRLWLPRGHGLSYSDCCTYHHGFVLDTCRLNHIISFDTTTGIAICQPAVTFSDLLQIDADFIPPVMPGTLYATLGGGIANDIHGKNNPHHGSLGEHLVWFDLQVGVNTFRCSPTEHSDLFHATIAGLGLTGMIKRLAIRMQRASQFVEVHTQKYSNFSDLFEQMKRQALAHDYQVAWLDFLNRPQAILTHANHVDKPTLFQVAKAHERSYSIPRQPVRLIRRWLMKGFNLAYFHCAPQKPYTMPLWQFNNPLDCIHGWNHLYGKSGFLQFQAVFSETQANPLMIQFQKIIHQHRALATLAVLKYFTRSGIGLFSFPQPGFTLAIDFINNRQATNAICAMNQRVTDAGGKIYLAKDNFLNRTQFTSMYPQSALFSKIRKLYDCPMSSDLAKRLGFIE